MKNPTAVTLGKLAKGKPTTKIKTWSQLLADPRVAEVWTEDNDGTDYWVALKHPWQYEGQSCIHEWSKKECIEAMEDITPTDK